MLGDVGDPELVRQISRERSINQILCRGQWWDIVTFTPSGDVLNIDAPHKERHGTAAHLDPQPLREFRVHPHCNGRPPAFGLVVPFNNFVANS